MAAIVFAATYTVELCGNAGMGRSTTAHLEGAWYLGHFWSLALEEQFYWFWPPLLIFILQAQEPEAASSC